MAHKKRRSDARKAVLALTHGPVALPLPFTNATTTLGDLVQAADTLGLELHVALVRKRQATAKGKR